MNDADVVVSIAKNKIPGNFWDLPQFEGQHEIADIHAMVVERLQIESPDADMLELMMMERVCFLYIFMRATEQAEGSDLKFDRVYKDTMSLWVSMAADLRKTRLRAEETASIRMAIVSEVSKAIKEAMKGMDPNVTSEVTAKLIHLVS